MIDALLILAAGGGGDHGGGHGNLTLIADLGAIAVVAALVAIVFERFKMPVILGYVLAGLLMGGELTGVSMIQDRETVQALSELGVLFLLFSIGLEFDLLRLQRVLGPALLAVVFQTAAMILIGLQLSPILGLDSISGVFLGSLLSISSSMVTIKTLNDQNRLKEAHGQLAVGILIMEDVLAIILLVVLTGLAVKGQMELDSLTAVTFFIAIFVVFIFWLGKMVIPPLLAVLNKIGSTELIAIFSVGLVLGIGMLAARFEFSPALGAFVAGTIVAFSRLAEKIEHTTEPLKDLFSAVFFVSVGLMINPDTIIEKLPLIGGLSVLVIFGKIGTCWLGMFLAGVNGRTAFRGAVVKSQIGEFSFIIAGLGLSLGVTDERLSTLAIGVSLVTILATPFLSGPSLTIFNWINSKIPTSAKEAGEFYHNLLRQVTGSLGRHTILKLIRRPLLQITRDAFIISGIVLGSSFAVSYLQRDYELMAGAGAWLLIVALVVFAGLLLPFLIAVLRNVNVVVMMVTETILANADSRETTNVDGRVCNTITGVFTGIIVFIIGAVYVAIMTPYLPPGAGLGILLTLIVGFGILFYNRFVELNSRMEVVFLRNFNEMAHDEEIKRRTSVIDDIQKKYPWPVKLEELLVKDGMSVAGMRIRDLELRSHTGVSIIAISRGKHNVFGPSPEAHIFPGDKLTLLGTPEQIEKATRMLAASVSQVPWTRDATFGIERVYISGTSPFNDSTFASLDLRKHFNINVIGVQRGERQITNPPADFLIKPGDVLMAVGTSRSIERFKQENDHNVKDTFASL